MKYFSITTTHEVAEIIKSVLASLIHAGRSIATGDIRHQDNYSVVQIVPRPGNGKIELEDIFWLGYFTKFQEQFQPEKQC